MDALTNTALAGAFMAALGGLLAWLLALANKRLYVYEDPRIDQVEELLPKSNCGACGTAGCRNFAEQVVAGEIVPARCTVNPPDMNAYIASFLGVAMGDVENRWPVWPVPAAATWPGNAPVTRGSEPAAPRQPCPVVARPAPGVASDWVIAKSNAISTRSA